MDEFFGWDLMLKVSERDINKKEDILTLVVHFALIKNGYKCNGLTEGDEKEECGSEILPTGWNSSRDYSICYTLDDKSFVLKGVVVEDSMVYNLVNRHSTTNLEASSVAFDLSIIKGLKGPLASLLDNPEYVMKKIKTSLIEPHSTIKKKETTTQTSGTPRNRIPPTPLPLLVDPDGTNRYEPGWPEDFRNPLGVGSRDLDPLAGGGGGGMLFNPFRPRIDPNFAPRFPRAPPGARFDPAFPHMGGRPRPPPDMDPYNDFF